MKNKIEEQLREFAKVADKWFQESTFLEDNYKFFNDFFQPDKINGYGWNDFQGMKTHIHAFNSFPIARENALGKPNLDIEEYKRIFKYIKTSKDNIDIVINNLIKKHEGGYYLPYFGNSSVSELIVYAHPNKYVFYNSRDVAASKILGIEFETLSNESFGSTFKRFNETIQPIIKLYENIVQKRSKTTIQLEVDQFFSWLYENNKIPTKSFKQIIDELREKLKTDVTILNKFVIKEIEDNARFAWVQDQYNIIGNSIVHYEIIKRRNNINVEIHFEGKGDDKNKFYKNITKLPEYLEWFDWRNSKSIGYNDDFDINSESIVEQIKETLLYLEKTLGDKIRTIINNNFEPLDIKTGEMESKTDNNYLLNQILYGPPGTGKTYHTIDKAIKIANPDFDFKQDRDAVKEEFSRLVKLGQIVFTTFHQSMSYEDFIEGIKPLEPKQEGQSLTYKIIDGIFKKVCAIAAYNCYKLFTTENITPTNYTFDDLYDAFINNIIENISNNKHPVFKTKNGRDVEIKEINSNNSIIARAKNSIATSSAPLTKENLQKLYDKFKSINEIENLQQVKETVQITPRITEFYAVFRGLKEFEADFKPDDNLITESKEVDTLDFDEIQKKFNSGVFHDSIVKYGKKAKPVVLIIDEINRGNVSQIFGELITLIEEDKRLGKDEWLEITLPYSKEKFGVPPNLYIIGTMNTADRSVEALDTALRRRFSFEEMKPKEELINPEFKVGDYSLSKILEIINNRVEVLLDKDHKIGHSYFMFKDKDNIVNKTKDAFNKNIIPLLQEYFYGDYGKIGLVLGKGFVEKKTKEIGFAKFEYDKDAIEELLESKIIYEIKYHDNDDEFKKAIENLINNSTKTDAE